MSHFSGYRRVHQDASASPIDAWMKARGASVLLLDSLGKGKPDRLYGFRGANLLVELKTGKGKRTLEQELFAATWRGQTVYLWRTEEDAAATLRSLGFAV